MHVHVHVHVCCVLCVRTSERRPHQCVELEDFWQLQLLVPGVRNGDARRAESYRAMQLRKLLAADTTG